jgi:16S rRNA (guanine966-N2)-methyltransferase
MKDRVREAVFNLLGPTLTGKQVIDLFAGTGAMAFEALSRGAKEAILVERRFPNVRQIERTAAELGLPEQVRVFASDTFYWVRHVYQPATIPSVTFCCPPYALYAERLDDMLGLIHRFVESARPGSLLVVECDTHFDTQQLPASLTWDVRTYLPAVIAIAEVEAASGEAGPHEP